MLKFGLLLYSLTYVASWFSGLGLILIFIVAIFTIPKTYELYKEVLLQNIKIHYLSNTNLADRPIHQIGQGTN
jgi:hypothetical protein